MGGADARQASSEAHWRKAAAIPLVDLNLPVPAIELPGDVREFLREADRRIERFQVQHHIPGFVPSDFPRTYAVLHALAESDLAAGNLFCEWGSGFGVVTCLAAMLDFDAWGVEVEGELVEEARRLARDFDVPAEFVRGSFIPRGAEVRLSDGGFCWLATDAGSAWEEMDLGPDDFAVIFAYPWPDEERAVADLFDRHAAAGAVLATYHSGEEVRLRRKLRRRTKR